MANVPPSASCCNSPSSHTTELTQLNYAVRLGAQKNNLQTSCRDHLDKIDGGGMIYKLCRLEQTSVGGGRGITAYEPQRDEEQIIRLLSIEASPPPPVDHVLLLSLRVPKEVPERPQCKPNCVDLVLDCPSSAGSNAWPASMKATDRDEATSLIGSTTAVESLKRDDESACSAPNLILKF
eukprot:scaffold1216_cov63-Cyclotella_meneghiniana.AAC.2